MYNLGKIMFPQLYFQAALIMSLFLLPAFAKVEPCSESFSQQARNRNITGHCQKKTMGAEFGWKYSNDTRKLEILFGAKLDGEIGWLAWGLNPGETPTMIGTRALVGIKEKTSLNHSTYNITGSTKLGCGLIPSNIELQVLNFSFFAVEDIHAIQATIILPEGYKAWRANVIWQVGFAAKGEQLSMHPLNLEHRDSKETIDLISGSTHSFDHQKLQRLRHVHGILNILGWGTMLPIGAIIARYFRRFPFECPGWFSLHIMCQILGYTLGTVGFVIGLLLGGASGYYNNFRIHRIMGIFIFTFATLQMLALRLKPTQKDDYRVYWNMYHHFLGYALLVVISINIFHGIAILSAGQIWNWSYVGILVLLGILAFSLELFSWLKFCYMKAKIRFPRRFLNSSRVTGSGTPTPAGPEQQDQQSRSSQ